MVTRESDNAVSVGRTVAMSCESCCEARRLPAYHQDLRYDSDSRGTVLTRHIVVSDLVPGRHGVQVGEDYRQLCQFLCQLNPAKSYIERCEVQQRTTRTRGLTTFCDDSM